MPWRGRVGPAPSMLQGNGGSAGAFGSPCLGGMEKKGGPTFVPAENSPLEAGFLCHAGKERKTREKAFLTRRFPDSLLGRESRNCRNPNSQFSLKPSFSPLKLSTLVSAMADLT